MHLNAKYLRNGRGYLTYGKSRIEMNVWCIWINGILSIQINSRTKVWYSRWYIFWIVCIILEQIPALLCRISFVTILQANVIFECMHLYMTCAMRLHFSLSYRFYSTRARSLNKTSPLKNASNSRVWCEIKTTALSLFRSYPYWEQWPAEMISIASTKISNFLRREPRRGSGNRVSWDALTIVGIFP